MPCYQINYVSVEFKVGNKEFLEQAAKQLNWSYVDAGRYVNIGRIQIDFECKTATVASNQQDSLNKLKQAYSVQAVIAAAKKKKWAIKVQAQNKLELRRY